MSLLFYTLSRFVIAFLPRSKRLLILWLQSPSAAILEPKNINSVTDSIVFPSICHEMMGPDVMILVFWMLSFKPAFPLSFAFIKRLFSSSSPSAIRVVSSASISCYFYFSWQSWFQFFFTRLLMPICRQKELFKISSLLRINESESEGRFVMSDSLRPHGPFSPWNSSGQNTGVGNLSLLQGIFPTQGSNPGLLHCGWILYQLSHQGSPVRYCHLRQHGWT